MEHIDETLRSGFDRLRDLRNGDSGPSEIAPIHPRVLVIVHDPPLQSAGGARLSSHFHWHNAVNLAAQHIEALRNCSGGYLNYRMVDQIDAYWYAPKEDGFRYDEDSLLAAWRDLRQSNKARIDYPAQLKAFNIEERHRNYEFDEVWFFSHPYAGDYESTMAGPGAFWCNSPPVRGTEQFRCRMVIMAFKYERGVDCMLENFGHRTESIMKRVYANRSPGRNMRERFIRYN